MEDNKVDFDKRVEQYIQLRDIIREKEDAFEKEIKPFKDGLNMLNAVLLNHLNVINADNTGTQHGVVYKTAKASASIEDGKAFWEYVYTRGAFSLLDKRANVNAVADHMKQYGTAPPGVKYSVIQRVGVRRKS